LGKALKFRIFATGYKICCNENEKSQGQVQKQSINFKYYKERWQIETAFRALKSGGFNIEDTHLTDLKRIEKLFSTVTVAFAWAYAVGIFVMYLSNL
jgi:transposase